MEELKERTRPLHDQVEATLDSAALMRPDFSKEEYRLLLKRLWWAHNALEPSLEADENLNRQTGLTLEKRLGKRHLLEKDLALLGVNAEELEPVPPALLSDKEKWGALYVLEGSTLGGAMIHKKLREQKSQSFPLNFYGAYGAETGMMWSSFRQVFTEKTTPYKEWCEEVVNGAEKAYHCFLKGAHQFPV